jgi:hypothetical protein
LRPQQGDCDVIARLIRRVAKGVHGISAASVDKRGEVLGEVSAT